MYLWLVYWCIGWLIDWLINWLMYLWLMYWLIDKLRKPYFFRISLRGSKERNVKPKKKLKKNIKIRLKPRMWVGVEPPTQLWFYFNQAVIPLLDHRDKDVREEGKKLIIESYRWIGNTYHLLIILSCRVSHILLDRAQFKKLGFSELLEQKNCTSCMQKIKGSSSILCLIWCLSIEIIQYDMGHCKSADKEKLINSFNHEILRFLKHYLFYI